MKFLHAADIHLDSPLRGLSRYPGCPAEEIRGATRQALQNMVTLAIDEKIDFMVIAGDIYDGDWKDYNTGLFFASQMTRLAQHGIPVFMICGNHDAACSITKSLKLPKNVHEFGTKKASTVCIDELRVAVHGQGFHTTSVTENLVPGYPEPVAGYFNLGILHTSVDGREGHDNYAPCRLADLQEKNYQYWALGHIHIREQLSATPYVLFPGNIQGRHIKETGDKGVSLVSVDDDHQISVEHRCVDVLRWEQWRLDLGDCVDSGQARSKIFAHAAEALNLLDVSTLAVRLTLTGACRAHAEIAELPDQFEADIRQALNEAGDGKIWLEKLRVRTRMALDLTHVEDSDDFVGDLLRSCRQIGEQAELQVELLPCLRELAAILPDKAKQMPDGFDPANPDMIKQLLPDVQTELLTRLLTSEATV